jgi:hypothetical protein
LAHKNSAGIVNLIGILNDRIFVRVIIQLAGNLSQRIAGLHGVGGYAASFSPGIGRHQILQDLRDQFAVILRSINQSLIGGIIQIYLKLSNCHFEPPLFSAYVIR